MKKRELAEKLLELGDLMRQVEKLQAELEPVILELGKTQVVGDVRATYSKGRGKTDYQKAVEDSKIDPTGFEKVAYDYKKCCEYYLIDTEKYYTPGEPTVCFKLEK